MLAALLAVAAAASPIPSAPLGRPAEYIGAPATPRSLHAPPVPQHPHMAPDGNSLLHEDTWQSDASRRSGPLGRDIQVTSTFFSRECASVTFDSRGRIVSVCVGVDRPQAVILDARTLATIATYDLPPRESAPGTQLFTSFGGGGYFYLDDQDRAVVPTTTRHVFVLKAGDGFSLERDYDLSDTVPSGDSIISALPDWDGAKLWFASRKGVFGTVDIASGEVRSLTLEPIGNSFATGEGGGAYVVTDGALYRFALGPDGGPLQRFRVPYDNTGETKPGQTQAGSGTTPTLMARRLVAITDNADPMNVVVYTRAGREVCKVPVFGAGASATDNSLIAVGRALVVENNYGYSGPSQTSQGGTSTAGLARVDVARDLSGCAVKWTSDEIAPSVVPKASTANGLVYTYTKPPDDRDDPWYLTALDFRTGTTVWKALAGTGLGFNNNYAPVSIGADGTAYVGTLGGLVALRDAVPPAQPTGPERPRLRVAGCRRHPVLAGRDTDWVRRVRFGKRRARVVLTDYRRVSRRVGRLPRRCASGSSRGHAATGG